METVFVEVGPLRSWRVLGRIESGASKYDTIWKSKYDTIWKSQNMTQSEKEIGPNSFIFLYTNVGKAWNEKFCEYLIILELSWFFCSQSYFLEIISRWRITFSSPHWLFALQNPLHLRLVRTATDRKDNYLSQVTLVTNILSPLFKCRVWGDMWVCGITIPPLYWALLSTSKSNHCLPGNKSTPVHTYDFKYVKVPFRNVRNKLDIFQMFCTLYSTRQDACMLVNLHCFFLL